MTIIEAQLQYDKALAEYKAIPSRSRKLKHAAAENYCAARQALKDATAA
jgi:hypothetical protein